MARFRHKLIHNMHVGVPTINGGDKHPPYPNVLDLDECRLRIRIHEDPPDRPIIIPPGFIVMYT